MFFRNISLTSSFLSIQNEDTLKKCVADYQSKLKKQDERYQALKAHAEEKLEQYVHELFSVFVNLHSCSP